MSNMVTRSLINMHRCTLKHIFALSSLIYLFILLRWPPAVRPQNDTSIQIVPIFFHKCTSSRAYNSYFTIATFMSHDEHFVCVPAFV